MSLARNLYDQDFYAWTQEQAKLIKQRVFKMIDIAHLEEELESMGASEQRSLESKLTQLMMHMLKLKYQPDYINTKSWIRSIICTICNSRSYFIIWICNFFKVFKHCWGLYSSYSGTMYFCHKPSCCSWLHIRSS